MRADVLLIGCGSAASWMINKLLKNKGGLHNRVTKRLHIAPFTISESAIFLQARCAKYTQYQIVQLYMVFGGIPFYLEQIDVSKSDVQNINNLCFGVNSFFKKEYDLLFSSLFNHHERHQAIISVLSNKKSGMTRNEIILKTKLDSGGTVTTLLNELEESSFIRKYPAIGKKSKDHMYQIVDFYSLFYLNHIRKASVADNTYWTDHFNTSRYFAWAGYSFELLCLTHVDQIKNALGITGISSETYSWFNNEAQIDLIIDRRDNVINLCEIKFSLSTYKITKKYAEEIQNKVQQFIQSGASNNKAVFPTILTTNGLDNSIYNDIFMNSITLDMIFI